MKKVETEFEKIMKIEIVFSLLYALLGIFIFWKSEMTNNVVGILIGMFFLISGMLTIFTSIDKVKIKLFHYNIFFGILSIVLGILIMLNPLSIINILNISLGIWTIVKSINKIIYFVILKKVKENSNKLLLVSALFLFFLGILLIIYPFRSIIVTKAVGIFILLINILNINDLVLLKKRGEVFLKLLK